MDTNNEENYVYIVLKFCCYDNNFVPKDKKQNDFVENS